MKKPICPNCRQPLFEATHTYQCLNQVCVESFFPKNTTLDWRDEKEAQKQASAAEPAAQEKESSNRSVLAEAEDLINGPRRESYGDVTKSFEKVAVGWSSILNVHVTPRQVALAMIWLKVCRDIYKPNREHLVDICGYGGLAEKL